MLRSNNARLPVRLGTLHDLLLVLIVAIPVFGTFFPFSTYFVTSRSGGDATYILALILLIICALFLQHPQKSILSFKRTWLVFVFCFWVMYTSTWSEVPRESFTRSGRLFVYALYAIYLAEILSAQRSRKIMGLALLISLGLSFLAIALLPGYAGTTDGRGILGTWRGAMAHKNSLGIQAGLGFLFGLASLKTGEFDKRLSLALVAMSAVLLVLANSVTAILGTLLMLGFIFYAFYIIPTVRDRLVATVMVLVLVLAGGLSIYAFGSVLELFGRDGTLTGRSDIWAYCDILIQQNPFWGYGHGAWKFPLFQERALVTLHWPIAHAHNTWLDLRLQLGLPGFLLGASLAAVAMKNLVYLMFSSSMKQLVFPVAVFSLFGIRSFSETVVVDPSLSDMFWFVFAFASFAKLASQERARRREQRVTVRERGIATRSPFAHRRFGAEPISLNNVAAPPR